MVNSQWYNKIEQAIGYVFENKQLLHKAFVHPSKANDVGIDSYNGLEHFGDSIVGICVTQFLFDLDASFSVEELTKNRAKVVEKSALARASDWLDISQFVLVSPKQVINDKIKSDIFESLTASLYLDSRKKHGFELVFAWLIKALRLESMTIDYFRH